MIRTAVIGAAGRMGRCLIAEVINDPELDLAAALEMPGHACLGQDAGTIAGLPSAGVEITDDAGKAFSGADAVIDFSAREVALEHARQAARRNCAIVIGTTGLTGEDRQALEALAANGARIVCAPNMSVGVNLLFHLAEKAGSILAEGYDIEIVEMHHNRKKDAPSGTAARLGEILAAATGRDYKRDTRHGRHGMLGARTAQEIGMHALRGGDVVGEHTVIFATNGERIELTHKASSRQTFAKGALRAVKFLRAIPGNRLYDMQDVLGFRG